MIIKPFNYENYYMGDTPKIMKYTKWIEDLFPDFRLISYKHDIRTKLTLSERNNIVRIVTWIASAITYGLDGVFRGLKQIPTKRCLIGVGQIGISIIASLVLAIPGTPYYLIKHKNTFVDLSK